ncbi:MAG: sugar ABC transporter ATP-binding protein [Mesorhizobium sp.]|uniref:sugar ABC transporter ATP-binding protein n=1 Tax=Mesorhizobium sp. TaxID=1871066 RepID=UPI001218ED6D|nr:sugar ABC transporter ATP-binding protein [Mesorhizobium sp.]TIO53672.1 MAG: sugar ABC transporter ATP-binding protein [Mesorhizobium sp.]TIO58542.1 MAG: sugar ABC transporter ATP-binding protein [Mesorhizobium sp.]TJV67168.1 MAG: sugar ABC transporter ATP-binding protein [Mesorhizobium sp.]
MNVAEGTIVPDSLAPDNAGVVLTVDNVFKRFGPLAVLDGVSLTVSKGAIHGLLGKNGAGKSTLSNIIAGLLHHDGGSILLDGEDVSALPLTARRKRGLHLLSQHSEIFEDLSIGENLLLPELPKRFGLTNWPALHRLATRQLESHGMPVDPRRRAGDLGASDRRRLAIIKAVAADASLIILDEPTAGLAAAERLHLLEWVESLTEKGTSFIYISHHNDEVRQLCSEYTVLRDGKVTASGKAQELSADAMARVITGADVAEFHRSREDHPAAIELSGLAFPGGGPVDLTIGRGEIVGLVGLLGEGPQELMRALGGLLPIEAGVVVIDGYQMHLGSPRQSLDSGVAYLTHDRIGEGLVGSMSVTENLNLGNWPRSLGWLVSGAGMNRRMHEARGAMDIVMGSGGQEIGELSGGNQQKVLLGRLLERKPRLLLLDEPTVGVDVAAKEQIHRLIDDATKKGVSVLLLAQDPEEMQRLVDRVVIFSKGRIARTLQGAEITIDAIAEARTAR